MVRRGRGYRWADATPGNTIALKSGIASERAIVARLPETREEVIAEAPWLENPVYGSAVERYVRIETLFRMLSQWATRLIERKGAGAVKPYHWIMLERYARTAAQLAEPLGLDPRSRVELEKLMADAGRSKFDLAKHWQEQTEQEGRDGR
jgi:hypothetical protein